MRCLEEMEEDNDLMDFVRETFDEKYEFIASGINALDAYLRDELEVDEEKTELEVLSRVRLFRLLYNP